jgi:O6-methylguanine-DNA--protein-cysteine methyltransferase
VRRSLIAAALLTGTMLTLSACGGSGGQTLAQQACVHVRQSLHDLSASEQPGQNADQVQGYVTRANRELRAALPLAADANSADGTWNSLMTTISEGATVDESHLAPALKAQCAVANTNINVNPQNVNPQNVNPESLSPVR